MNQQNLQLITIEVVVVLSVALLTKKSKCCRNDLLHFRHKCQYLEGRDFKKDSKMLYSVFCILLINGKKLDNLKKQKGCLGLKQRFLRTLLCFLLNC